MRKKMLIVMLALAVGASAVFAGCGAEAEPVSGDVTESVDAVEAEPEPGEEEEPEEAPDPYVTAEWTEGQLAALSDLFGGSWDMEFEAGTAGRDDVHAGVTWDGDIVACVVFNTTGVDFDDPGEYAEGYAVHFLTEPLISWMEENGIDPSEYAGLDGGAVKVIVRTTGTIAITEPEEAEEEEDGEDADEVAGNVEAQPSGSSSGSSGSSSGSSKSSSSSSSGSSARSSSSKSSSSASSSSKSSSSTCSHNWVATTKTVTHDEVGHYDTKDVKEERYVCNNCGYSTRDDLEIMNHCNKEGCGHSVKDVVVDTVKTWVVDQAEYTETVTTGYKCSKCGATKDK